MGDRGTLIADRFVSTGRARAIDLATGDDVILRVSPSLEANGDIRWANRCDRFLRLHHHAIARLVDFGALGASRRFEAWRCGGRWEGSPTVGARIERLGRLFLAASGLSAPRTIELRAARARPVLLPDNLAGHECPVLSANGDAGLDIQARGLDTICRPAVAAVAELLAESRGHRPRAIRLDAPDGAGVGVALGDLARVARIHGYVPLSIDREHRPLRTLLRDRSLFLISRTGGHAAWRALAEWSAWSPGPHVLVLAGLRSDSGLRVPLEAVPSSSLVRAVRPAELSDALRRRVEKAATEAHGLPGRFARRLWGPGQPRAHVAARTRTFAAERSPEYGAPGQRPGRSGTRQADASWPAVDELAAIRERTEQAIRRIEMGRHVTGERTLRRSVGRLARRRDWCHAARGAMALSRALLTRGRAHAAQSAAAQAQEYAAQAGQEAPVIELAVVTGRVRFARGHLQEAEHVLRAAVVAAQALDDRSLVASARFELAGCLFWQGRYREADDVLEAAGESTAEPTLGIRLEALAGSVAVGRGDLGAAVSRSVAALDKAICEGHQATIAVAASCVALAHLCAEDHGAVARDVATAIGAARLAHDPLTALGARLIGAESCRRRGRIGLAQALLSRLHSLPSATLPHVLRARCGLLSDLVAGGSLPRDIVARRVASTGLGALALFAPPVRSTEDSVMREGVNDVLEILRICQQADEDGVVLRDLCTQIRKQTGAAGAAFFVRRGGTVDRLAGDGGRWSSGSSMAERVMSTTQFVPPYRVPEGSEGGAVVRCGGETIGALVVRWTVGDQIDLPRTSMVLTTAAIAAAPAVAAAVARQVMPRAPDDFIGISAAAADLRRAVERAAGAPFSVLVLGESGSGKELVARALHRRSPRRDRPFGTLNCAALPDDLVESELFGHSRGAFTGAVGDRPGVFEDAHLGTLFLDEVGELSPRAQAKVLRTIQEGELRRVGENVARRIDVRIVSATNRDLTGEVAAGRFRLDLLYRLDVLRISVPPLRERREDIPMMIQHFWRDSTTRVGSRATLGMETVAALASYGWPGNVRELQNVLAALAVRSSPRGVIPPTALPAHFGRQPAREGLRLIEARRTFEERFVRAALVRTGGHRTRAAAELGVSRQGLSKLMARLGIVERVVSQ